MLAFSTETDAVLVDCGGDALQRSMAAGIPVENIRAVILTHEHPDHVGGWALLIEKLWLHGRRDPIPVYGPKAALVQAESNFATYNTERWEGVPKTIWHDVELAEGVEFLEVGPLKFTGSPADHGVPCLAIRVDNTDSGASVCYSSDTKPSQNIARLGRGCDIVVHEASGQHPVHSSAEQAAQIARDAGCKRLVLVHLPPGMSENDLSTARSIFAATELGSELAEYSF